MNENNVNLNRDGDFVFRFKLERNSEKPFFSKKHALQCLMRDNLNNLLNLVVFTYEGKEQKVNGFVFLDQPEMNVLLSEDES